MTKLDPARNTDELRAKLEATQDPFHRQLLHQTMRHIKAEGIGDLEGLMRLISPRPRYQLHGGNVGYAILDGYAAVHDFYRGFAGAGLQIEIHLEDIAVEDWGVAFHAKRYQQIPGRDLVGGTRQGPVDYDYGHLGEIDPDAYYRTTARTGVWFLYEVIDGVPLCSAEIAWTVTLPGSIIRLAPEDVITGDEVLAAWARIDV